MRSTMIRPLVLGATLVGLAACAVNCCAPVGADEGMWLFDQPPRKLLIERYGFDPTDAWLDHLQHAAVEGGELVRVAPMEPTLSAQPYPIWPGGDTGLTRNLEGAILILQTKTLKGTVDGDDG